MLKIHQACNGNRKPNEYLESSKVTYLLRLGCSALVCCYVKIDIFKNSAKNINLPGLSSSLVNGLKLSSSFTTFDFTVEAYAAFCFVPFSA